MKLRFFILIVFLAAIAVAALPQQPNKPLGKEQIADLVKAGMETPDLVRLIREHGVSFDLTEDYLQSLRDGGAQPPVIQALRDARPKPLSKEQVLQLMAGHVPNKRAAALVTQRGIDFLVDDQYLDTLRLAGADDNLISTLQEASAALMADLLVEASPGAQVYWDGQLLGPADSQGEFRIKTKFGSHALKVTLAGKKDIEQNITLEARQSTQIQARLADLGATLVIQTSPGAVVYLNGVVWGFADSSGQLTAAGVPAGVHELHIVEAGKKDYLQNITVAAGQQATVTAPLADLGGTLVIRTIPGAAVFVDGTFRFNVANTGLATINGIPAGTHEVRVTMAGRNEYRQSVNVTDGTTAEVRAKLIMLAPAQPINPVVGANPSTNSYVNGVQAASVQVMHWHKPGSSCTGTMTIGGGRLSYTSGTDPSHSFNVSVRDVEYVKLDEVMAKYQRKRGQAATFFYLRLKNGRAQSYSSLGLEAASAVIDPLEREMMK